MSRKSNTQSTFLLRLAFFILFIAAGADKFVGAITDWNQFLPALVTSYLPVSSEIFLRALGVIEIAIAFLCWFRPHLGGYVAAIVLWTLIAGLILLNEHRNVIMLNTALSLCALALARQK